MVDGQYKGKSGKLLGGKKYSRVKELKFGLELLEIRKIISQKYQKNTSKSKIFAKKMVFLTKLQRIKHRTKVETWTLQDAINNFLKDKKNLSKQLHS